MLADEVIEVSMSALPHYYALASSQYQHNKHQLSHTTLHCTLVT